MPTFDLPTLPAESPEESGSHPPRNRTRALLTLCRPYQWLKNPIPITLSLISVPHWTFSALIRLFTIAALFTLASIAVYILNDILDRDRDRQHPKKRYRPIAAGEITPRAGWILFVTVCVLLCAGVGLTPLERGWLVCVYAVLNLAYSFRLKHIPLVEAFVVATGFVLRMLAGYAAIASRPSPWLLISVLAGCLLLVLGKRRGELADGAAKHRPALGGYSVQLLDQLILMSATLSAVGYMLFLPSSVSLSHDPAVFILLSVSCAVFAIFRYLQLLVVGGGGGDPSRTLIRDRPLIVSGVVWTTIVVVFHTGLPVN